ncbi:MAG: hypothetical protein LBE85_04340 [Candidatus Accumulibacter sp.]|nr:hypothetical protein [Accumulibacter sp.]
MSSTFIFTAEPAVRWPVTVRLPADGGAFAEVAFEALIRVYSETEFERLTPAPGGEKTKSTREVLEENADILPRIVIDWFGVLDARGDPAPIASLAEIIRHNPYGLPLSAALWRAINEVRFGLDPKQRGGETVKNSVPSPAAGRATVEAATS